MSAAVAEPIPRRVPAVPPVLFAVPLAATVATAALVALSAVGTRGFLVPSERRGARGWIDGPLAGLGFRVTASGFALELGLMAAAYVAATLLADRLRPAHLVTAIVAAYAIFGLAPPLLSTDVFNYIDYARLGVIHHLSPYQSVPAAAPQDVIYRFVHWRHRQSAYGPLFTLASYPLGYLQPAAALWTLKATAALAGAGSVALVARIAGRLGRSPRFAATAFGLNPIVLVWAVGGGHNDMLMLLVLLAGVALVVERREALGGAALATALAVKATAGLAIPFALLGSTHRRRLLAGLLATAVATVGAAYVGFPDHGAGLVGVLARQGSLSAPDSVPHELARLVGINLSSHVLLGLHVGLGVALVSLAVAVWRSASWPWALGWAFVALVATSTWIVPWYLIWSLPFAAVTRDRRLLAATLVLQVYLVVNDVSIFAR